MEPNTCVYTLVSKTMQHIGEFKKSALVLNSHLKINT